MLKAEKNQMRTSRLLLVLHCGPAVMTTPDVPRYTPTAKPADLSTPVVPALGADAFGAGLGEGLQRATSAVAQMVKEGKEKADTAATIGAIGDVYEWKRQNLYDPEKGALFKKGAGAFNVDRQVDEDYKKFVSEKEQNLANEAQKTAFRRFAFSQGESITHETASHVSRELDAYAKQRTEGALKNAFDLIGTNPTEANLQQVLPTIKGFIVADAAANKEPAELTDYRLKSAESQAHSLIVERLSVENPLKAKEYFEANANKILPTEATKIERTIKPLVTKQAGMGAALELASSFNSVASTGDLWTARDKALTEARAKLKADPDALNIAETQIRQMASEREQGIKIMQNEAAAPVYAAMTKARQAQRIPSLRDIPAEAWATLERTDPDKANDILKGIQTEVRVDQERREVKQERNARRELVDEQKAQLRDQRRNFADLWGNPRTLATANIDALVAVGQLSPEQGKNLEERRKSANQDTLFTETREIERIMGAAKVKPKTEQADQIIGYIEQRKAAFKTDNGRAPKTSEVADMAREALYKVDVDWSPIDKPAYKMTLDDIPKDHRAAITAERTRRNLPTSDSDIISTYARGQARKAKGGK